MTKSWLRSIREGGSSSIKEKVQKWREEPRIVRIDRPTRLDRARRVGYKAKAGCIVARVRLSRRGKRVERPGSGRRPKALGTLKIKPKVDYKEVAINRTLKKFPNLKALGAYYVYEDGKYKWYEVVMVDPTIVVKKV